LCYSLIKANAALKKFNDSLEGDSKER